MLNIPNADKAREKCNSSPSPIICEKVYKYNTLRVEREINDAIEYRKKEIVICINNIYTIATIPTRANLPEKDFELIAIKIQSELIEKGYCTNLKRENSNTYYLTVKW